MTARPHLEFAPPAAPGLLRALALAILAHVLLLVALSLGVQWKSDPVVQTFEAELWSSVPVEAAPPAPELEPPKPAPPEIKPEPQPAPKPVVPPPPTAAELKAQADIALAKEKEKLLKEKKLAQEKLELEKKKQAEQEQKKLAELEKKKQAELEKQKQARLEQDKKDKEKLAADKEKDKRLQDQKEAKLADEQRKATLKRMAGLAGAGGNGAANSTSTSLEAKSLSNSYAGRIRSYIKRFLTYTETISGNPTTEIEVRLASDGSILSRRITKASGVKSWDDAALSAIDKAEKLPLDENGRAPSPMTIVWSAQEVTR